MDTLYLRFFAYIRLSISCLLIFSSSLIFAEPTIQIVTENTYPWNYLEENNSELKGFSTELITEVMNDASVDFEITVLPWARAYNRALKNKNTLIYSIGRNIEREDKFIWIGKIFDFNNNIYGLKKDYKKPFKNISELKNCITGVVRGGIFQRYFESHNFQNIVLLDDYEQIILLLKKGRIDCYGSSKIGANYFLEHNGLKKGSVIQIFDIDDLKTDIYLAANINSDLAFINKIKESFIRIKESGRYLKIMQPIYDKQKD